MAKKFGKFLLLTAAVGTAAAAAYYFMQKKDSAMAESQDTDNDYDDFCEDLDDDTDTSLNYVPLNRENTATFVTDTEEASETESTDSDNFTPLTEQVAQHTADTIEETCEEFFDEEDSSDEEPSIED